MGCLFRFKATRDLLTLLSVMLIAFFIYRDATGTYKWILYQSYNLFADLLAPVSLLIAVIAIGKKKNWGRWLFIGYSVPAILFDILQDIDINYTDSRSVIGFNIFAFLVLTCFFMFSTYLFFNKESKQVFIVEKKERRIKRPISIWIISIVMLVWWLFITIKQLNDLYERYELYTQGVDFYDLFSISGLILMFVTFVFSVIYPVAFFLGKAWGRILYSVRAMPVFLQTVFIYPGITYHSDMDSQEIIMLITLVSGFFFIVFYPMVFIYNKKANDYFV